jgi:predicted secreted protein
VSDAPVRPAAPQPRAAPEPRATPQPKGLGGWLIVVGIGLVVAPVRIAIACVQTYVPLFQDGSWQLLTTPGTGTYHPLWAPVLLGELLVNIAFFQAFLVLMFLFLKRARMFPSLYIAVLLLNLAFLFVDALFLDWLAAPGTQTDFAWTPLLQGMASAAIWIPYMLRSRRVRNTFVIAIRAIIPRMIRIHFLPLLLASLFVAACTTGGASMSDRVLGESDAGIVLLQMGSQFSVKLPSNPTTGFQWKVAISNENMLIRQGEPVYTPSPAEASAVGVGGSEIFTYRIADSGRTTLQFVYSRPFETGPPAKVVTYNVVVN